MRVAIVAGEPSGDLLAAELINALRKQRPDISFEGVTGPNMLAAGCHSLFSIEKLAVFGLVEVIRHIPGILKLRRQLVKHLLNNPPDVYIGIDSPDFNFPIEGKLKKIGIRTVHYNSPAIWAWRPGRIHTIAKAINLMLTLYPFEAPLYEKHNVPVRYIGHPLADAIPLNPDTQEARRVLNLPTNKKVIALLPGSRSSEIEYLTEVFLKTAELCSKHYEDLVYITPAVNAQRRAQLETIKQRIMPQFPLTIFDGQSHAVMAAADVVLVASGTATLEAMLLKRPMVVAYRTSPLTYWIGKQLVKVKYLSLPNLLANQPLVPEFIQHAATPESLSQAILSRLDNIELVNQLRIKYDAIHYQLKMNASTLAAKAILEMIEE